jgi:hypothetical protein
VADLVGRDAAGPGAGQGVSELFGLTDAADPLEDAAVGGLQYG